MYRTQATLLGVLVITLLGIGCATGPRPIAWDRLPFPKDSDWHGPRGEPAVMGQGDVLLHGQDVRTQRAYAAPVTIECDVMLESRTASDGSFDLYFLPTGQPLDVIPRQLTKFRIIYSNTGDYGSADRLEIDRQEGTRGFPVWTGPPFKVEAGKVYHVKINVLAAGKLNINVNGVDSSIPDTVTVPRSFQVQLGGWQPANRWRVRNFSIH
ncbi:MAG TPA: hypothetical protein VNL17_12720 [Verrucomicrobiae bacterium]|nr:hypothetical protein [Verrucomicrobiae bacterium]